MAQFGYVGLFDPNAKVFWKTEGLTDAAAIMSLGPPPGHVAACNACGATEKPDQEWCGMMANIGEVFVPHDNDPAGQAGATWVTNPSTGRRRPGWATAIAAHNPRTRNVILPGVKDIRDWITKRLNAGRDKASIYTELLELARSMPLMEPAEDIAPTVVDASREDDINLVDDEGDSSEETKDGYDWFDLDTEEDSGRTDAANAMRFVNRYEGEVLFVPPWKKWLSWDGHRWADDSGIGVRQRARRYGEWLWGQFNLLARNLDREELGKIHTFVRSSNQSSKIDSFLKLAAVDERVVCPVDELNADPLALNCVNGTLDLSTGKLRPHNPADRLTQITNVVYDPTAECPKWLDTLALIFDSDAELIRYVQQLLGYSISGDTGEHILPIAYGGGNNGKSTVWATVAELLGDYATLANEELLLGDKNNHPTEKASLYRKRFVAISEPEKNSRLRESRVKELTGDRTITARRMHEDFWSFERTHTFWISSNHLPRIAGTDEGIWRRVKLIPFTVDLSKKTTPVKAFDKWLITHEGPGILAWLVRGFLDYQANGLVEPQAVTKATSGYRDESDVIAQFVADHCEIDPGGYALATDLYQVYVNEFGGKWKQAAFGKAMGKKFRKEKLKTAEHRDKIAYFGLRVGPISDVNASAETPGKHGESEGGTIGDQSSGCSQISIRESENKPDNQSQSVPRPTSTASNTEKMPPRDGRCPHCDTELTPALEVRGFQNLDCLKCGYVYPQRVEAAKS